jgi:hypothetical protein
LYSVGIEVVDVGDGGLILIFDFNQPVEIIIGLGDSVVIAVCE